MIEPGSPSASAKRRPPLDGVRILAVSQFGAGPFGTQVLADLGAEVIKIEDPGVGGDVARYVPPFAGEADSPYFQSFNRGKRSITLNLRHPDGQAVLHDLVRVSDAVFNNTRGDLPGKLGLTYEALKSVNPRVVCCALTGFGTTGPRAAEPAYDYLVQGYAGYMALTGEPDGPPTSVGLPICDLGTGMWGAQGVLAALYERTRTGQGQKIECSLLETAVGFSSWTSAGWLADHVEPVRMGSRHRQNAPYQRFETADGYMMIGASGQSIWERCARALGHPEWLADPRFARPSERRKNRFALEKEITAVLTTAPTAHWTKVLDDAGVPCGPVYTYEQLFADPQVRHREMVVHADDAELGRVPHIRTPIRMSTAAVAVRQTAPRLGQHTDEILAGLGYPPAQVAELRRERVI